MTKLQRLIRRPADERGFTLIELLVVIIILGILAAVVVFAVSGVGDKGKSSAVKIDDRTLRTAEEAYCAKNGQYGSGQELIDGGFLSDAPEYHSVSAQRTGFGQCNGWTYSIVETQAASGVAAGTWTATAKPMAPATSPSPGWWFTQSITRLPNGTVVALGADNTFTWITSLWEPATGAWTSMDPQPGPLSFTARPNQEFVLTQNCGSNCGKLLQTFQGTPTPWHIFDPGAPTGTQWKPVMSIPTPGPLNTVTALADNPSTAINECGSNCGKVLLTAAGNDSSVAHPADLYDPNSGPTGGFTPIPNSDMLVNQASLSALLPDGRVLLVGTCTYGPCSTPTPFSLFFDPLTLAFSNGPPPTLNLRDDANLADEYGPQTPVLANGDLLLGSIAMRNAAGNIIPAQREIYTPQYRQPGYWTDPSSGAPRVVPVCGPSPTTRYCQLLGALPDGRVLAYPSFSRSRTRSATIPGQTFILDPVTRTWTRSGDFSNGAVGDGALLDPRTGPCGNYCNKMFMVGQPFRGGAYNAAFFTP